MSFRRFIQHEIIKKSVDPHELIRLSILISKNILDNPDDDTFTTIRMVKITRLCYSDILLLEEILVRLGFIKEIKQLEAKFILKKKELLTNQKLDDFNYILNDSSIKPIDRTTEELIKSNSELIKKELKNKKDITDAVISQFNQDREDVKERFKRFLKKRY